MKVHIGNTIEDYQRFLTIKSLPRYEITGRMATVPDEYADLIGMKPAKSRSKKYQPRDGLFDYQRDIVKLAISRKRFAIFADCGLGKTFMLLEFARHAAAVQDKPILIVSPLMVVNQTAKEAENFYGSDLPIDIVPAKQLSSWLTGGNKNKIGITNYDALKDDTPDGTIGGLILDESSMLKSHYGKWGQICLRLGKGVEWKNTPTTLSSLTHSRTSTHSWLATSSTRGRRASGGF